MFSRIEVAYQEAVALRRQEELIREEEAAGQAENEVKSKRCAVEKEKRTKKKQTKQKKGSRKGKDRGRDEKHDTAVQKSQMGDNSRERALEDIKENSALSAIEETKISADVSDLSDIGDDVAEMRQFDLEEGDTSPVGWDMDASEIHPPVDTELQKELTDKKTPYAMDDSSSTCSTDSVPSIMMNGPSTTNASSNRRNSRSRSRGKKQGNRCTSNQNDHRCTSNQNDPAHGDTDKLQADSTVVDTTRLCDATGSCRGTASESEPVLSLNDRMHQLERHLLKEEAQKKTSKNDQVDVDRPFRSVTAEQSSPSCPIKSPSISQQSKQTSERRIIAAASVAVESSSNGSCLTGKLVRTVTSSPLILKQGGKSTVGTKINVANQASVESRPLSAPLTPALRPITSATSTTLSVPLLSRSVSASGRLGVDPSSTHNNTVPQSYRNAIMSSKSTIGTKIQSFAPPSSSCSSSQTSSFSGSSPSITPPASAPSLQKSAIVDKSAGRQGLTFGSVNPEALQSPCLWKEEGLEGEATSSKMNNHNRVYDDVRPYFGGSCHSMHSLDDVPSGSSFHQTHGLGAAQDEFPHLDIINDLLNEEQSVGGVAVNGYCHHDHQTLNEQYTFVDDASTTAVDIMPSGGCPFDQVDHYYHDQIQRLYGCSSGPLEGRSRLTSAPLDLSAYVNGQNGGMIQNQWPLGMPDRSVRRLGSSEANGYAFHLPDYLKYGLWVERI
ncbi:hypothetical protein Taro_033465 [Colocasia esculenta]|uniref:Uncharacterized protein n=1 Tax=Colocasia esculenta TaxID=4460 RepID=A0A843VXZ5_COLES|nr:hypothetical protein [Colocasia esculenta]